MRSSGGQLIQGTVVEAPEIEVHAKRLVVESVLDTAESHAWSASINTSGAVSGFHSESDSAWVTTVTGLYASESLNVTIEGDLEIIGAVLDGPDEATFIDAERVHYSNIDEHSHEKSLGLAFTFVVDPKSLIYGSGIPVTIDADYHHKVEEGTTRATVAGDDSIEGINHDRDNVQTRHTVKDKHVRVFLPIISPAKFKESLEVIFSTNEAADIDVIKSDLFEGAEEDPDGSSNLSVANEENYTLISGLLEDTDGKGIVEYVEAIDWSVENAGNVETFVEHNIDAGTVTIGFTSDQRKTTIRMSEERFLAWMGFEEASLGFSEVSRDGFYYRSSDCMHWDEPVVLNKEESLSTALMDFTVRFTQGFGEGMLNAVTDTWGLINAYADLVELAHTDLDTFNATVKESIALASEAVQSEAFWNRVGESVAKELSSADGLGRVAGELFVGGVIGKVVKAAKFTKGISVLKQRNVVKRTADEVNEAFQKIASKKHYDPPYKPGTVVHEFGLAEDTVFARVFPDGGRVASDWLIEYDEIAGLTREQIKDKLSLPKLPDNIVEVHVPKGTRIRTGEINPLFGGKGGGVQFELIQDYETAWFKNVKKIN